MAAQTLDQVSVELEARVGRYNNDIKDAATTTERSLQRIETSSTRMERQVGQSFAGAAQRARNLGFQISDIGVQLSSGTSPFLVLAQQGPQVANALDGAKGAVGRFATFLSGPYGAAILAATTILGSWLTKNTEAGESVADLVEKLKAQEAQSRNADAAQEEFGNTLEGVTKAIEDNQKALDQLNKVQDSSAEATLKATERERDRLIKIRETTVALIEQAKAEIVLNRARIGVAGNDPRISGPLNAQNDVIERQIQKLEKDLQEAKIKLNVAQSDVREAEANVAVERASRSSLEEAERYYDGLVDGAKRAALASGKTTSALEAEVRAINKRREARLQEIRETESTGRRSTSSLPQVTGQEIARALGTRITSGTRTPGENAAARGAKNSYHLSGQAIDIPLTVNGKPLTKAGIRAVLEPLGVEIKELLGPGDKGHNDHFHIAFSKKRRGGDEVASSGQSAADTEERRRQTFENELASLLSDEVAAKRALTESAEEQASLRLAELETERKAYNDNLASLVTQRKLTDDEAKMLEGINDEVAKYRAELIKRNEAIREFRMNEAERQRDLQYDSATRADEAEVLQGQADLARTLDERNEIERRLVDLKYEEERASNDAIIAYAERLRIEVEAKRASQDALDAANDAARIANLRNQSIGERRGNDLESVDRNNPLDRYLDEISDTKYRAQEAVARELEEVNRGITDALTDELGIKNQFVKDMFSIFLDEVVFRPLTEALRNRSSGGGGIFGSIIGAVGSIFGGGKMTGSSLGGGLAGVRASGGPVEAGRLYRINEAGMEGFVPASSGTIIPTGQMNARAMQPSIGRQGSIEIRVYAEEGAMFVPRVEAISEGKALQVTVAAAPSMIDAAAKETMRRAGRPKA